MCHVTMFQVINARVQSLRSDIQSWHFSQSSCCANSNSMALKIYLFSKIFNVAQQISKFYIKTPQMYIIYKEQAFIVFIPSSLALIKYF